MMPKLIAAFALVPLMAFGGGKDIDGNDLSRGSKLGYVDGDATTVGDIADFANTGTSTNTVKDIVDASFDGGTQAVNRVVGSFVKATNDIDRLANEVDRLDALKRDKNDCKVYRMKKDCWVWTAADGDTPTPKDFLDTANLRNRDPLRYDRGLGGWFDATQYWPNGNRKYFSELPPGGEMSLVLNFAFTAYAQDGETEIGRFRVKATRESATDETLVWWDNPYVRLVTTDALDLRISSLTNSTRLVDGAARPLPKYLHALDFDSSYPEAAAEYYRQRLDHGGCSAMRDGGFLYRNFDFPFDGRAEFVVRTSHSDYDTCDGEVRFASVGVAQVGTNLTEDIVTSGKWSKWYKALPGATVDGINENGVCAEINMVDGAPQWNNPTGDIHPLAAVRWALDNGTSAGLVASNLALRVKFPAGWTQNFHYMIADEKETWIVENGSCKPASGKAIMTNFPILPTVSTGTGFERYEALRFGFAVTNVWFTNAYRPLANPWISDIGQDYQTVWDEWAKKPREEHRGESFGDVTWWQTVHTSVYDLTNRVLRIAVQETEDWYVFAVPSSGGGLAKEVDPTVPAWAKSAQNPSYTKAETDDKLAEKANKNGDQNETFEASAINVIGELFVGGVQQSLQDSGYEFATTTIRTPTDSLADKANRPSSATSGNLASLTENGDLEDSGISKDDVALTDDIAGRAVEAMASEGISSSGIYIGGDITGSTVSDQYGDLRSGIPESYVFLGGGGYLESSDGRTVNDSCILSYYFGGALDLGLADMDGRINDKADKTMISADDETFSAAVLAVGLNIDEETLQWLKDIGAIAGTTTGKVGIGTLLAALLAALMWLKRNKADQTAVDAAEERLNERIDLVEATSHPNMSIVGSPTFREGVVSGFSANDYLMFPTNVDVKENAVDFFMAFTTGANVTTQQNILDSWCGLAFAIQNGGTVTAASQNGTTFVTATSANTIAANTSYRLKLEFRHADGSYTVTTKLATGSGEYSQIGGVVTLTAPVYPTATYWGGANPTSGVNHIFGGSINLAECRMDWNGKTVWRGYTEVPTYSKGVREDGSPADQELHDFFTESNDLLTNRVSALTDTKANSVSVAPEFDSTKTYAVDEMVMHGGNLYRCTTAVTTAGAWNEENWTRDAVTHGDTAFLRDEQGHLVIRETEGQGGAQPQTLYVDAYRLAQDTVTHVIKDAAINEIGEMANGVTLALPPAIAGHSRDFAVELSIGATVPAFVFPLVEADLKPYSDAIPTWAANTVYCISFTEFPDGKWRLGVASKEVTA